MKIMFALSLLCATIFAVDLSYGADPTLGYSAIACEPWHEAVQGNGYAQRAGRVSHSVDYMGKVNLFCPVFNTTTRYNGDPTWNRFTILFKDPDGTGSAASVGAGLRYVDATGNVKDVAAIDSNKDPSPGTNNQEMTVSFEHKFDFNANYYYVQIGLSRTDKALFPEILGFKVWEYTP